MTKETFHKSIRLLIVICVFWLLSGFIYVSYLDIINNRLESKKLDLDVERSRQIVEEGRLTIERLELELENEKKSTSATR